MSSINGIEYPDGLTEITVKISSPNGGATVPGLTHRACPGLAVTMFPFGCFSVTHISTGRNMANTYERASSALHLMGQFALVAATQGKTWEDLDVKAASELISAAKDYEMPVSRYSVTEGGQKRAMTIGEWFQAVRMPFPSEFPWEDSDPFEDALDLFEKIEAMA